MEKRYDRIHYLNTGTVLVPVWSLVNKGVVKFDDALAPKTETTQYIADQNEQDEVVGYKPSFAYEANFDSTDDVSTLLYGIGADQLTGEVVEIQTVDLWTLAVGACESRKADYNVIPEQAGSGAPGGALKMSGKLSQTGAIVKGSTVIATKVFTPTP